MIRVLPVEVANKIAAGEVVERPASVVKELVENALDAGATRIDVAVEEGGKKLVRVTDDGSGMTPEDLLLAFAPHATSKIASVDDLFEVLTYGFRGEALASIGSISRARILTRLRGADLGHVVTCEGNVVSPVLEAGAPEGTMIEVRDLFFNTPARRKFLKSDSAEIARVNETVTRLILPRPDVKVRLTHNTRRVLECDAAPDLEARVRGLFGKDLDGSLVPISAQRDGLTVSGLIGLPEVARGRVWRQYFFLNDRYVQDRSLSHAVTRGFEGFLTGRRYPVFFIELTLDPRAVDVNVHPTKSEVRFRDRDMVFSAVQEACRRALEAARPSAGFAALGATGEGTVAEPRSASLRPQAPGRVEFTAPARRQGETVENLFPASDRRVSAPPARASTPRPSRASGRRGCHEAEPSSSPIERESPRFMQLHDSYILVEDARGLHIVDQHALHERKLFEEMVAAAESGDVLRQRLLVPEVVELSPAEAERVLGLQEELSAFGLDVAPFGGSSIAVEAVPVAFQRLTGSRLVEAVLSAKDEDVAEGFTDLRKRMLAGMACRAAVKFNDRLADEEIRDLLEWERTSPRSASCPHGRPTRMEITLEELYRRFLRKE